MIERYWRAAGRGRRRRPRTLDLSLARGGGGGALAARGRGAAAADLRRAARRLPQRRDRLQRGGRDHGRRSSTGRSRRSRSASRTARASTSGPYAQAGGASATRTDHHEFVVQPDAVDLVERLVWHHDQPFGDSSAVPTFLLSELTRGHVTVALSGDGGDEVFAGYERFAAGLAARRFAALPAPLRRAARGAVGLLPAAGPARARRQAAALRRGRRAGAARRLPRLDQLRSRTPSAKRCSTGAATTGALEDYRAIWDSSEGARPLDRLLDLNLRTYLLDDLLVKTDRMSMAHGLEVRCPFLDTELLAFAARLPPALKARGLTLEAGAEGGGRRTCCRAEILQPAEAGLRRAARSLVPRGPARLRRPPRWARRTRASRITWSPEAVDQPDRRARRAAAQPRPRAVDPADARGVPAARGLVIDGPFATRLIPTISSAQG